MSGKAESAQKSSPSGSSVAESADGDPHHGGPSASSGSAAHQAEGAGAQVPAPSDAAARDKATADADANAATIALGSLSVGDKVEPSKD